MKAPDKTKLRRYLERGMTQNEIAVAWEAESGVRVGRTTIAMAIERLGLSSAHPRPRYEDMLPWVVAEEHRMDWNARMLRLEGRKRAGQRLAADEQRWLQGWLAELDAEGAVVTYDRTLGFQRVPRRPGDDVIRRPV